MVEQWANDPEVEGSNPPAAGTSDLYYKTFTDFRNKLESLSLASFYSLV